MKHHLKNYWILAVLIGIIVTTACDKMEFAQGSQDLPKFSSDSIRFDTVFTTLGSAVRILKIYNPHDKFINIEKISISDNKRFRLNVDGLPGTSFTNIEIGPKDSLYVFCEVTIDPNQPLSLSPFVIVDSIMFKTNGTNQRIILEAWGQNANYFPSKASQSNVSLIDLQGATMTWDNTLPYIVYGVVYIDNGIWIIEPGTKVYVYGGITRATNANKETFFYNDGRIIIGKNASIKVRGTLSNPVIFQGVRLEKDFENVRGQWSGIALDEMSRNNSFDHVIIRNNILGVYMDSLSSCSFDNVIIYNNSAAAIVARSADITVNNSLFYNQGQQAISVITGGNCILNYCTFANYGNDIESVRLSNFQCVDFPICSRIDKADLVARVNNCIMIGSNEDEFWMDSIGGYKFDVKLQNCIYRVKDLVKPNVFPNFKSDYTSNCVDGISGRIFKDISKDNYHLDSLSIADMKAIPINSISKDLDGKDRNATMPDIGCYEYK